MRTVTAAPIREAYSAGHLAVAPSRPAVAGTVASPEAAVLGMESLVTTVCRAFTQATGWRLEFQPLGSRGEHSAACWEAVLSDGQSPVGSLRMHAPRVETACSFLQASELAGSLTELVGALAEGRRRLASRTEDLSTLVSLGMAVPVRENLTWSLSQLLRAGVRLTASRSAAFFLLDPTLNSLRLSAVWQVTAQEIPEPHRRILESSIDRDALCRGSAFARSAEGAAAFLPEQCRSALVVPVESETMPLGTLWMFDRRSRAYGEHERHVMQSIAAQVAGLLERVALLRGNEDHVRITRELEQATQSQPSLLPNDLPADSRYELAAHVASCQELGGDLCEIVPLAQGRVGLAVGDASGHGIAAAMVMAAVRGAIRVLAANDRPITETMGQLNQTLYQITRSHQFMSLCYGVFDPALRRLTYVNAGHPLPMLLRRGTVTALSSHGLLLGIVRETEYGCSTMELQAGDLVVLYTDGISEARGGHAQMFRADGIAAALVESQHGTAQEILTAIWNRVEHHLAGTDADDDRTLVVLRVH